jgi:hypothetical protein
MVDSLAVSARERERERERESTDWQHKVEED